MLRNNRKILNEKNILYQLGFNLFLIATVIYILIYFKIIYNFGSVSLNVIFNISISFLILGYGIRKFEYLKEISEKRLYYLMPTLLLIISFPSIINIIGYQIKWVVGISELIELIQLPIVSLIFIIGSAYLYNAISKNDYQIINLKGYGAIFKYHIGVVILFFLFVIISILLPYYFKGTYIDEYTHITSAKYLIDYGQLPEISQGTEYTRGIGVTFLVSLLFFIFDESVYVAKLAPAIFGIGSFVCLFFIGRLFLNQKNLFLLLLIYSINIGVILNHFYIRFYSMYEFLILLSCVLFLYGFFTNKQAIRRSIFLFLLFNILIYLLSSDNGAYMIIIFNFIYYSLYLIRDFKPELKYYLAIICKSRARIILFTSITFIIVSTILFKLGFVDKIFALFAYSNESSFPSNLWGYKKIFFVDTPILGLFILFPLIKILLKIKVTKSFEKISKLDIIYVSFIAIFLIHLLSAKDIQLFRGIFYLLPLFFLFAVYGIAITFKKSSIQLYIILLSIISLLAQYPSNFFSNLTIPKESVYIGSELYFDVKTYCENSIIISSQYPYVLNFHSIAVNYFHQEKTDGYIGTGSLIIDNNTIVTSLTKTPTITNLQQLEKIISNSNKICYIERSPVVRAWQNPETVKYIDENFKLISTDINQRLFIKY